MANDTEKNPHSRAEWCQVEARSAIEVAEKTDSLVECEGLLEIATSWLKLAQEYRDSEAL